MTGAPPPELAEIQAIIRGYQRSRALTVAAELGIADLLADGPRPVSQIAASAEAHEATLYRVLRALASIGVFHEAPGRVFALTPMGELLRSDHPLSARPLARMFGADYQWQTWGALPHAVRTGTHAAVHALGVDVWEHRRAHPEDGEVFDAAMRTLASADVSGLLGAYAFGAHRVIADVGGGTGALLAALLRASPETRGILFDLPHVVDHASAVLDAAGVADRVEIVGGSFFDAVPAGADAYLLRRVLHDWMEPEAAAILRSLRTVMGPDARLLLAESVVGEPNEEPVVKFLDLMMLVSAGGRERTQPEWDDLLAGAGFRRLATHRATPALHVIVAAPA
jgi:hypothetical protein